MSALFFVLLCARSATIKGSVYSTHSVLGRISETAQLSFAVNIPKNTEDLNTRLLGIDGKTQAAFQYNKVYRSETMVAAKVAPGTGYKEHAEYSVLENMDSLQHSDGDFLLLYTYLSPCARRCANPAKPHENILELIKVVKEWKTEYALVFQKPYIEHGGEPEVKPALTELAKVIGYENIFRCYKPVSGEFQCIRCFSGLQNIIESECTEDPQQGGV